MKRKIIRQANQAYTLTLPIEWVRDNNLNEKSEVEVIPEEKSLIIKSDSKVKNSKAKFNVEGLDRVAIYRVISSFYAKGIDEIELTSQEDISGIISNVLATTLGYALVSKEKNKFVIKDLGGGDYTHVDEIFKRVFQIILVFYDSAIKDILGDREETIESLKSRDIEVNKFCYYLQRAVNKMSYPNPINGRVLFTYSYSLEKIGDEIERLWRNIIENKIKKSKEVEEIFDLSKEGLSLSFDLCFSFNNETMLKLQEIKNKIRAKSEKINTDKTTTRAIRHAVKIVEDASDMSHLSLIKNL
jgi:phosphate uptake regulator